MQFCRHHHCSDDDVPGLRSKKRPAKSYLPYSFGLLCFHIFHVHLCNSSSSSLTLSLRFNFLTMFSLAWFTTLPSLGLVNITWKNWKRKSVRNVSGRSLKKRNGKEKHHWLWSRPSERYLRVFTMSTMTVKLVFRPVCQTTTFLMIICQRLGLKPAFIPWTPEWWTLTCGLIIIVFLMLARTIFSTTIPIIGNQGVKLDFFNTFQMPKLGLRMAYPMEVTRLLQMW